MGEQHYWLLSLLKHTLMLSLLIYGTFIFLCVISNDQSHFPTVHVCVNWQECLISSEAPASGIHGCPKVIMAQWEQRNFPVSCASSEVWLSNDDHVPYPIVPYCLINNCMKHSSVWIHFMSTVIALNCSFKMKKVAQITTYILFDWSWKNH